MHIDISVTKEELGKKAAAKGAGYIREALAAKGFANIIVATGASQFEVLDALTKEDIDWSKITAFHLDEYIGLHMDHPASFRKYLKERFVDKVPINAFHYVNGEGDPYAECARLNKIISNHPIDVTFAGIGENGHLAFNDPPADFEVEDPYIVVELDEACRKQQYGEGWFESFEDVPMHAISMSVQQIMKSGHIICSIPDERKAQAVQKAVEGPVTNQVPSSILQRHGSCWLYLDRPSASMLSR
jgi:glucosamine-6-phosphate deaminase